MRILLRHFVTVMFAALMLPLGGQSPFFKSVPILKNKNAITTQAIYQDSHGSMWFATSEGLICFDGNSSKIYNTADSIDNAPITAISEDASHTIWLGHKNGVIEYANGAYFKRFNPEEGLSASEISTLFFDATGTFWFGTLGEGLYYYSGKVRKRLSNINAEDGLNDNYVYSIAESANGKLYIGTDNGISEIDKNTNKVTNIISMHDGLPDNIVKQLQIYGNQLWIGMDEKGICIYDLKKAKFFKYPQWEYGSLTNFVLRNTDECWINTRENGIVKILFDGKKFGSIKQYTTQNGLPANVIQKIYADREGNIWGSASDGIFISSSVCFEFINKKSESFDQGNVFSFIALKNGQFWAATEHGLLKINPDSKGHFNHTVVLANLKKITKSFVTLYQDVEGYIWAGSYGYGAFRINPTDNSYTKYDTSNGLPDNNILSISGNGNDIWFATAGGGAASFQLTTKAFKIYNTNNGLSGSYLYSVFVDSKSNIWFALDGKGVSVLKNGTITNHIIPDNMAVNTVYAITEDGHKNMWFLTADQGLIRFDGKSFSSFNVAQGLLTDNIRAISANNQGNVLVVSNEGMQIYQPERNNFESFGDEQGVAYLEPNLNGVSKDAEGNIWISTTSGIVKYISKAHARSTLQPLITVNKILLFFEPLMHQTHTFSYSQNHLSFEYSGIWFQAEENLHFRYKLENYDFDWSLPVRNRSVTYSNLPPGKYVFKVEVSHKPGVWVSSSQSVFAFSIRPPFYKTWWFIVTCLLGGIAFIYYYIKARTAKLLKAKEDLEKEVIKRTATIQQQKEEIETQRDEIEAQRDFVTTQRDKIALQNEHITSNIQYASKIQQALQPQIEDIEVRFRDFFILNRPMAIVSGDFYWTSTKHNRTFLTVADCTGHGVSGAFMSVLGISLLNKIVNVDAEITAAGALNLLRDEIKYSLRQTGKTGETQDGMDIALVVLDKNTNSYQFAGANNPLIIIRNKELVIIKPDKMPIGIFLEEKPFANINGHFQKNDMVYLFSDGYQDQLGGPTDIKYKTRRFHELLVNISELDVDTQREFLNEEMNAWKNGRTQNDDILVLGFRITS